MMSLTVVLFDCESEHGVSWENTENMERMENIKQMT